MSELNESKEIKRKLSYIISYKWTNIFPKLLVFMGLPEYLNGQQKSRHQSI